MLEPEEPTTADASAEPTWDEGESGAEESLAETDGESGGEASASGEMAGGEQAAGGAQGAQAAEAGGEEGGPAGSEPGEAGEEAMASASASAGGVLPPMGDEAALDAELQGSLEVFEGEMERTILILASSKPLEDGDQPDAGGGGSGEEEGEGGGPFDQTGEGQELVLVNGDESMIPAGTGANRDGQSSEQVTGRPGLPGTGTGNEAYPRIPEDVGSGEDDDVVARQIREAALNEDDPVLREKLWEEYRRYKASTQ